MAKINTRVTLHASRAVAMIKAASNDALTDMGNRHCRMHPSMYLMIRDLESNGLSGSDTKAVDGKYTMRWNTPYAQYLWNGDVMYGNQQKDDMGRKKSHLPLPLRTRNGRSTPEKYTVLNGSRYIKQR